jgi:hypothetical protein
MRESSTPFPRNALGLMELQVPVTTQGKTMFRIERVSLRRMLPFWFHWFVKAPLKDWALRRKCRAVYREELRRHETWELSTL